MLLLSHAVPALELLIIRLEDEAESKPHLAGAVNSGLDSLQKYYDKTDHTKAYVISMGMASILLVLCYFNIDIQCSTRP